MQTVKSLQTERVTYLTSAEHKAALEAFAKKRGESVGNVVREATARYITEPDAEQIEELTAIVAEVAKAVPDMQASLRRSIKTIEESRDRIDRKMRAAGLRK